MVAVVVVVAAAVVVAEAAMAVVVVVGCLAIVPSTSVLPAQGNAGVTRTVWAGMCHAVCQLHDT